MLYINNILVLIKMFVKMFSFLFMRLLMSALLIVECYVIPGTGTKYLIKMFVVCGVDVSTQP